EPCYDTLQLHAFDEEDRHRQLCAPDRAEEMILESECPGSHLTLSYSSSSRFSPIPRALSFRCSAERSIPMNDAVREMLPEKRRIWILRYSRSNDSRASRSGLPMIAIAVPAPLIALWLSRISGGHRSTSMDETRSPGARNR